MLEARKVRVGAIKGDRRSIKRGTSIEFADYRNYVAGDDLRQLDWNIYARLERPYIKLLEDEEDLAVHLILDASASMDFPLEGETDQHKLLYAKRIMAGLAYVSLTTGDRLALTAFNGRGSATFGPVRGRAQGIALLRFIGEIGPRASPTWMRHWGIMRCERGGREWHSSSVICSRAMAPIWTG